MSDLLSGLRKDIASGNWTTNDLPSALAYNQALHEVREALRSDETVTALAGELARDLDDEPYWSCVVIAKRIVATLAGGDQ